MSGAPFTRETPGVGYYRSVTLGTYVRMDLVICGCPGEAHKSGGAHLDSCAVCLPYAWGYVLRQQRTPE